MMNSYHHFFIVGIFICSLQRELHGFYFPSIPSRMHYRSFKSSFEISLTSSPNNQEQSESYNNINIPQTTQQSTQNRIYQHIQQTIKTISIFTTLFSLPLRSVEAADGLYFDSNNKFSLIVPPPHWSINDKKFALPSTGKYLSEEILFSAVNIQERCSMSVTKSDAKRLLKDFEIEYWFAPLETLQDVGTAELISQLLILQRDEAFESKSSASTLLSASFLPLPDKNALVFTYQAPIDDKKVRETIAKTIFQNGQLYTLWISSRPNVIAGEYGQSTLMTILQSFTVFP